MHTTDIMDAYLSLSGRRRKRRRPIIHYSEMMQLQTPPTEQPLPRSIRPKMELPLSFGHTITTPVDTPTTPMTLPTSKSLQNQLI